MIDMTQVKERLLRKRITELASPSYPAVLEASANDVPALIAEVERLQSIVVQVAAEQNPDNALLRRAA